MHRLPATTGLVIRMLFANAAEGWRNAFVTSVVYTSARKKIGLDAPVAITSVGWRESRF